MKRFAKFALNALMLAGAAATIASPATAAVSVGIGVGPGYGPPPVGPVCDLGTRFYNPNYCGPAYYGYGPDFVYHGYWGGGWHGGFHGGVHGGGHHR